MKTFKEILSLAEATLDKPDGEIRNTIDTQAQEQLNKLFQQLSDSFQPNVIKVLKKVEQKLNVFALTLGNFMGEYPEEGSQDFAILSYTTEEPMVNAYVEMEWKMLSSGQQDQYRSEGSELRYDMKIRLVMVEPGDLDFIDESEMSEDTESFLDEGQIDELSKKTLGSYVKKAVDDRVERELNFDSDTKDDHHDKKWAKATRKLDNRHHGVRRAVDKLTKEDLNEGKIEAYGVKGMKSTKWRKIFNSVESMEAWAEKNDAEIQGHRGVEGHDSPYKDESYELDEEQIDELSKSTLGKYVKAAHRDKTNQEHDAQRNWDMSHKMTHPSNIKRHDDMANKAHKKSQNRTDGLNRAVDKLTKEDTELQEAVDAEFRKSLKKLDDKALLAKLSYFRNKDQSKYDAIVSEVEFRGLKESTESELRALETEYDKLQDTMDKITDRGGNYKNTPTYKKSKEIYSKITYLRQKLKEDLNEAVKDVIKLPGKSVVDSQEVLAIAKKHIPNAVKFDKAHNGPAGWTLYIRDKDGKSLGHVYKEVNGLVLSIKEDLNESPDGNLTADEAAKKEKIMVGLKKKKSEFQDRYGDGWEGVMHATASKLAQEGFDLDEDFDLMDEAWEMINELSKKTLGSYVKKAAQDQTINGRMMYGDSDRESNKALKNWQKRDKGIKKAVDKLTKESLEEAVITKQVGRTLTITADGNTLLVKMNSDGSLSLGDFTVPKAKTNEVMDKLMTFYVDMFQPKE